MTKPGSMNPYFAERMTQREAKRSA